MTCRQTDEPALGTYRSNCGLSPNTGNDWVANASKWNTCCIMSRYAKLSSAPNNVADHMKHLHLAPTVNTRQPVHEYVRWPCVNISCSRSDRLGVAMTTPISPPPRGSAPSHAPRALLNETTWQLKGFQSPPCGTYPTRGSYNFIFKCWLTRLNTNRAQLLSCKLLCASCCQIWHWYSGNVSNY